MRPIASPFGFALSSVGAICTLGAFGPLGCASPGPPLESLSQVPVQDGSFGVAAKEAGSSTMNDADEDGGDDAAPPSPTCALTAVTAEAQCSACILANCEDTCTACAANTGCTAIWTCINTTCIADGGPLTSTCGTECADPNLSVPGALTAFGAFVSAGSSSPGCVVSNCTSACLGGG